MGVVVSANLQVVLTLVSVMLLCVYYLVMAITGQVEFSVNAIGNGWVIGGVSDVMMVCECHVCDAMLIVKDD